jgi:serine O-acetyltransferase
MCPVDRAVFAKRRVIGGGADAEMSIDPNLKVLLSDDTLAANPCRCTERMAGKTVARWHARPMRIFAAIADDRIHFDRAMSPAAPIRRSWIELLAMDSFAILLMWRVRMWARRHRVPGLNHLLRRAQTIMFGIEIGNEVTLGRGVCFVHSVAVVVGGTARIGDRVRFMGSNTVGTVTDNGYPTIEDDVCVGAGARILGPVRVGARSLIGANAVVVDDVPADSVAVGVPAVVRPRSDRAIGGNVDPSRPESLALR